MENMDKSNFSLDDDEIVEEEFIDRDEEYDDEDYDEDYDEEYDDEEYDDEGYDDEDYGDEDYGDEDYDDGYNDDYYDDRLTKVLDEIAEIKRNMAPSTAVQPPVQPMPPQYVYQPSAPPAGSEVVMYNEISRLRDELARNQSALEMQKELTHLKEDMARDQRFAESQYAAEIKRLQEKVEELQKNASSPLNELPEGQEQARLEGGNGSSQSVDFNKLLSINEAILRATQDSDAMVRSEIASIKKDLESFPSSEDLNKVVSAIKKAARNGAVGLSEDAMNGIAAEISSLRDALGSSSAPAPAAAQADKDIDASELLRQLYEIKAIIGSTSEATLNRTQTILDLIADFKKLNFDVNSPDVSFKEKLTSVFAFTKKLSECTEPDAIDLIEATNLLLEKVAGKRIDKKSFADIVAYFLEKGPAISAAVKESADKFFDLAEKVEKAELNEVSDYLPDLIAERNKMEENRRKDENDANLSKLTTAMVNDPTDEATIKALLSELTEVSLGDVVVLHYVNTPKSYKASRPVSSDTIFSKISDIKTAIENLQAVQPEEKPEEAAPSEQENEPETPPVYVDAIVKEVLDAIDELKDLLEAQKREPSTVVVSENSESDISAVFEDVRTHYLDISDKLVSISEKLAEPPKEDAPVLTPEEKEQALDDLAYIHTKLDDYEAFLNQIADIRADIAGISGGGDFSEQYTSLVQEITEQFDKLYQDISNAIIDSEANIINRLTESSDVSVALEAAKADILNDTQAILIETQSIRDSLAAINESDSGAPLGDAIEQLRADLSSFADLTAANVDASTADRQKLLEDVAFLREQAEIALSSDGGEAQPVSDNLQAVLDDLSARIAALVTVDDLNAVLSANLANVPADIAAAVNENLANLPADVAASVNDNLSVISADVSDTLAALKPIEDQLNAILDRLDAGVSVVSEGTTTTAVVDDGSPVAGQLDEIRENLATILDTISALPQLNDVITVRDNTYSILDTIALMPQTDDVVTTRDNVAALLDTVNALSESVKVVADSLNPEDTAAIIQNTAAILESIPEGLAEDIATVRDNSNAVYDALVKTQEDVDYIRQKLDEEKAGEENDPIAAVLQDIGLILDKLDAYEQTALGNKQEIVDNVNSIKEEIHIRELNENISAEGFDSETRETLVSEIADVRERLSVIEGSTHTINEANAAAFDGITAQLADIQARLDAPATSDDVLALLADINDRLNALAENGVHVAEDENAAAEGVNLQTVLDEISLLKEKIDADDEYDTIGEILSLREDVKAARIVDQSEVSGELEAIKNELAAISSEAILDEVRSIHDEISAIAGGSGGASATDGELNLVLNEIVSLRDEVFAFKDEVTGGASATERAEGDQGGAVAGDEIVTILDELSALRADQTAINDNIEELKEIVSRRTTLGAETETETDSETVQAASDELNVVLGEIINLKGDIDRIEQAIPTSHLDSIAQQVEDIRALVEGLQIPAAQGESEVDITAQLDNIYEAINELRPENQVGVSDVDNVALTTQLDGIRAEIQELKEVLAPAESDVSDQIEVLRAEIAELRAENEQLRAENAETINNGFAELREAIREIALSVTPAQTDANDASYAALIDEIRSLKEQVASATPTATLDEATLKSAISEVLSAQETEAPLSTELSDIRDEIAQLRSLTTVTAESGGAAEVAAIRNELYELRQALTSPENMSGIAEDIGTIKSDVQILKEEPDLGVLNEILALREEFQALREEIEDVKTIAGKNDRENDEAILNEVQSLRDQLFAISMANVNDSMSGESNYESYNNIILDEIASLREQLETAGSSDDIRAISDELAKMKHALDSREELYEELSEKVDKLASGAADSKILSELATLRNELADQREADLTTLNFMAEMAKILERKSEAPVTVETQGANNDAIVEEVAKLREEIAALTEREKRRSETVSTDESAQELEESLSDLKAQLGEIAGIVEPAKKPAKKSTKGRGKSGAKKSTGTRKKNPAKRTAKANDAEEVVIPAEEPAAQDEDFEAKLAEELAKLGGGDEMSLDPNAPVSSDVMDIADKLAKQVANKLIMEQLVEQLGDGGVSDERVDEILRDILPQEFTTVALTSQSDKVRQLANQLVINKLKARLRGIRDDED
ncbi:MAG: hypothetical protein J1F39_04070 [Clostridiales bacterium]|nr:hypothetical protein [Clostridiales bacterium]